MEFGIIKSFPWTFRHPFKICARTQALVPSPHGTALHTRQVGGEVNKASGCFGRIRTRCIILGEVFELIYIFVWLICFYFVNVIYRILLRANFYKSEETTI